MSLPDIPTRRSVLVAVAGLAALALSGCSFTPVYGPHSAAADIAFTYADPASRLEQIVYRDLRASFASAPGAPLLSVTVTASTRAVSRTASGSLFTGQEEVVTGEVTVVGPDSPDKPVFSDSFQASATYETSGQVLADNKAQSDAEQRAAHSLAQTIRLALLGAFANR